MLTTCFLMLWSCCPVVLVVYVLVHVLCSSRLCFVCDPMVFQCVSSVIPWFFNVFPPDICLVCVYDGGDFFV